MHYYQHHIGDFLRDTSSLSQANAFSYLKLLWMYYDTEAPLPDDPEYLAFKIGASIEDVKQILKGFFTLENGVWNQRRCDAEIAKFRLKSDRAKTANQIRWQSKMDTVSEPDQIATNKPITNNKEYIDRFDDFWKHYPRKVAKPNALKAWLKLKPDDALTKTIISAISNQNLASREQQFIPHPASWLNAQRWNDETTVSNTTNFPFGKRIL
jgi:uncharacterized protein YdaU (DUF1376 family)